MITLFDDWVILVDDLNYTLARDMGERTDKDGKVRRERKVYGYYGSLRGVLTALMDKLSADELKDGCRSLCEAVRIITESHDRVEKLIKEVIP